MDIHKKDNRNSKDETKAYKTIKNSILDTFLHSNDNNHYSILDDTSFESFYKSVSKKDSEKTAQDYLLIAFHLEKTELVTKYSKDGGDSFERKKLLFFCAMNMEFKLCESNEILLREGDSADCFFINFSGRLNVIKYNKYSLLLSSEEYITILVKLVNKNSRECILKTIKSNSEIFNINKGDMKNFNILLMVYKLKKIINDSPIKINSIYALFDEYKVDPELFKLNEIEKDKNSLKSLEEKILVNYFHNTEFKEFDYLDNEEKKMLTIHEENIIFEITNGKLFGDIAIDNKSFQRTATIRASTDSYLGKIKYDIYREYILSEKQKILAKDMAFLNDNFFFKSMKPYLFRKKIFYDFVKMDYNKGKVLINEREITQNIYFLKEGEVELKIEVSLIDLNKLINNLIYDTKLLPEEEYFDLPDMESKDYELNKKKTFKIYIYGSKEIIGADCFYLNIPSFYKAFIHSEKAKIFRIDTKKITSTLNEDQESKSCFEENIKHKFTIILKRLIEIRDTYVKFHLYNNNIKVKNPNSKKEKTVNINNIYEKTLPSILTTTHIEPHLYKQLLTPEMQKKKPFCLAEKSRTALKFSSNSPVDHDLIEKSKNSVMNRQLTNPRLSVNRLNNSKIIRTEMKEERIVKKLNKTVNFATEIEKKKSKSLQHAGIYDQPIVDNLPKISVINLVESEISSDNSRNTQNKSSSNFKSVDSKFNFRESSNNIIKNNNNIITIKSYKKILDNRQSRNKESNITFKKKKFLQDIINK